MVKLLFQKMLRDIRRSGATYLICMAIVAVGFCGYSVLSISINNLAASKDYFFRETAYCDGYAEVQDAPLSLTNRLAALPGVERVDARLVRELPVRGFESDETRLRVVSVTEEGMNRPLMALGSQPRSTEMELVAGSGFFKAHKLKKGDSLTLAVHGQERAVEVAGHGISPENIYMVRTLQELLPAVDRYDMAFMSYESMAKLLGEQGMANQFLFAMKKGVPFESIQDEVEKVLKPYGFIESYDSGDDVSVSVLNMELEEVAKVAKTVPYLFLSVAAIILYIMLHRLLDQQRTQIGTLLAIGLRPKKIRFHYMCYGLTIGVVGGALGGIMGNVSSGPMTDYYRVFFQLPQVHTTVSLRYFLWGIVLAGVFCGGVAWLTTRSVCNISPSEALRPPAPPGAHRFILEWIPGFLNLFTVPGIMALRSLARHKRRTFLSLFGIACAFMITATLVSMNTLFDVYLFDELEKNQQQDITVSFTGLVSEQDALSAVASPYMERAEGVLNIGAKLKTKKDEMDTSITGISEDARLYRLYDKKGNQLCVKREGIVISELMASLLGVSEGDFVTFSMTWPEETEVEIPVTGIMAQYLGSTAYMSKEAIGKLTSYRNVVNSVVIKAPVEVRDSIKEELKDSPLWAWWRPGRSTSISTAL